MGGGEVRWEWCYCAVIEDITAHGVMKALWEWLYGNAFLRPNSLSQGVYHHTLPHYGLFPALHNDSKAASLHQSAKRAHTTVPRPVHPGEGHQLNLLCFWLTRQFSINVTFTIFPLLPVFSISRDSRGFSFSGGATRLMVAYTPPISMHANITPAFKAVQDG